MHGILASESKVAEQPTQLTGMTQPFKLHGTYFRQPVFARFVLIYCIYDQICIAIFCITDFTERVSSWNRDQWGEVIRYIEPQEGNKGSHCSSMLLRTAKSVSYGNGELYICAVIIWGEYLCVLNPPEPESWFSIF